MTGLPAQKTSKDGGRIPLSIASISFVCKLSERQHMSAPFASQVGLALSGCQPQSWPKHGCCSLVQNLGLTIGGRSALQLHLWANNFA